jgi:hypothetical protein
MHDPEMAHWALPILTYDIGNAMEPLTLPVSAPDCLDSREIYFTGYLALGTIGQRRGFYVLALNLEIPAVDTEPAMFNRLFFIREALHHVINGIKFTVCIGSQVSSTFI